MVKMSKAKEILLNVIELYKSMPYLWDKKNVNYFSKDLRLKGNRVLLHVFKECDQNATIRSMTKKIQNLRTSYYKELSKVRKAQSMGTSYIPSLWYYDAMGFLAEKGGNESYNEDVETVESEERWSSSDEENENERLSETPSTPPPGPKRQKRSHSSQTSKTNMIQMQEHTIDIPETVRLKDADYETLGKSIGIQLRDLNRRQLTITQKLISDAIYYARMDMLTEKSHIALERNELNPETSSDYTYQFTSIAKTEDSP